MIIAFWSNLHGQPRTTSNMLAVSLAITLRYQCKTIITQTHFNLNQLESYLIGSREQSRDVFMDVGLDGLARSVKFSPLNQETIEVYSIPLIHDRYTLLPGTSSENRTLYMEDMGKTICTILKEVDKYHELVFVDMNSGLDELTTKVLDLADIVVVNLCQNRSVMDTYFKKEILNHKKMFYLIGSYDKNSILNLHNLRLAYHPLRGNHTAVIPYNTGFMDAQSNGDILSFMQKNLCVKKGSTNAYFTDCVLDASDKLMKLVQDRKGG